MHFRFLWSLLLAFTACFTSSSLGKPFIGRWLSGFFGESLQRYRYDLESGTSYYQRGDGSVDSWQTPQSREFYPNSFHVVDNKRNKIDSRKFTEFYTNLFLR